jgi:hypothetical protein
MVESFRLTLMRAAMCSDKSLKGKIQRATGLAMVQILGQTFVEVVKFV